ncbi:MAG: ATP-binding protein [Spirochaetales bacterium]
MSERTPTATLMVVDDNPVNLQLLFESLGSAGYRILVCEDGETAVRQAKDAQPDLILMDVLLPGISGYDSCRAIRAQAETSDIPIIFLTALTQTNDKLEGFDAGGVDYLTKPLQLSEVLARVSTHLSLRNLRRELEDRNQELKRRDERRERLFSIIAHDLKSPMATFVSATRLLAEFEPGDESYPEMVQTLKARAHRLDRQISELLAWGEYQISEGRLSPRTIDLTALIDEIVTEAEPETSLKRLAVVKCTPESLAATLDPTAVRTIVSNILGNAIKFTPDGGSVRIELSRDGSKVVVSIQDSGIGMSSAQTAKLFTRTGRAHRPGTKGEGGSGLGLILASEIAELMGGRIDVTSEEGSGTTFSLVVSVGEEEST